MNVSDWQFEMQRLLQIFEQESTSSLRKINRYFVSLGRPFDEKFRQYFLKVSTVRLDTSFDTVLFERLDGNEMRTPSDGIVSVPGIGNVVTNNSNDLSSSESKVVLLNASEKENVMQSKTDRNIDATIEITDSDDDSADAEEHFERREVDDAVDDHMKSNASHDTGKANVNSDVGQVDSNVENEDEALVKRDPKIMSEDKLVDLPVEVFDPNKVNDNSSERNGYALVTESMGDPEIAIASSSAQKQAKRNDGKQFKCNDYAYVSNHKSTLQRYQRAHQAAKPFKCEYCDHASRRKDHLKKHLRIHGREKLMGIIRDVSSGLYQCTHCSQKFTKWCSLQSHLTQSHKNNQRLFNCAQCMRRFAQKTAKDKHEMRCKGRRYECYLCKKYVATLKINMQKHMRTHTGAKPFECAICNQRFRQKNGLNYHLNYVHS